MPPARHCREQDDQPAPADHENRYAVDQQVNELPAQWPQESPDQGNHHEEDYLDNQEHDSNIHPESLSLMG
jgi:hypothetical protein